MDPVTGHERLLASAKKKQADAFARMNAIDRAMIERGERRDFVLTYTLTREEAKALFGETPE